MARRTFEDIGAFQEFLLTEILRQREALHRSSRMSLVVLERNVRGIYGKRKYLKPLAMATQADRVRKGYTPNDPLLRDGRLLRDNVQAYTDEGVTTSGDIDKIKIGVGTHEIINAYHEHGYVNARTGRPVPPRPVFRIGAEMSEQEIMRIVKNGIKEAL